MTSKNLPFSYNVYKASSSNAARELIVHHVDNTKRKEPVDAISERICPDWFDFVSRSTNDSQLGLRGTDPRDCAHTWRLPPQILWSGPMKENLSCSRNWRDVIIEAGMDASA